MNAPAKLPPSPATDAAEIVHAPIAAIVNSYARVFAAFSQENAALRAKLAITADFEERLASHKKRIAELEAKATAMGITIGELRVSLEAKGGPLPEEGPRDVAVPPGEQPEHDEISFAKNGSKAWVVYAPNGNQIDDRIWMEMRVSTARELALVALLRSGGSQSPADRNVSQVGTLLESAARRWQERRGAE